MNIPRIGTLLLLLSLAVNSAADTSSSTLKELATERKTRPQSDLTDEEQNLMTLERDILKLFKSGQLDKAMNMLSEKALVAPPGMEAVIGREAQRQMFKEYLSMEGVELDWEPVDAFVNPSKDMGYVYGVVRWKLPGEPRIFGKYISVWVKEDGRWMNHVEMRNVIHVEASNP